MRILIFSDPQVNPFNQFARSRNTMTYLLEESLASLRWIAGEIEKHNPQLVVCAGDITESADSIGVYELNVVIEGFETIESSCKKVSCEFFKITGNHDTFMQNDQAMVHIVPFLDNLITTPQVIDYGGVNILFVPYDKDSEKVVEFLEGVKGTYQLGFVHLDINTVPYMTGRMTENLIDSELFTATTFNGHYHHPGCLNHIIMIGSLRHMNFSDKVGDDIPPRGYLIYDTDKNTYERYENPHTSHYYSLEITEKSNIKYHYDKLIDPSKSYVRISCPPELVEMCHEVYHDVKGKRVTPVRSTNTTGEDIAHTISTFDHNAIVENFIRVNAPDGLDKDWLISQSRDIIQKASSV